MPLHRNRWHPDTCACIIEFEWDDSDPPGSRTHVPVTVVRTCAAHTGLTPAQLYADLNDENPRKNRAEARLLQAFPVKLGVSYVDPEDGQTKTRLRPQAYSYSITGTRPNRVLNLALPLLNATERTQVQTWCDNNLGAGRVVVTG